MNRDTFVIEGRPRWEELDALAKRAGRRPDSLGPTGVRRLGALYRHAAADLAVARRRFPSDPIVASLEVLVGRARHLVYDSEARATSLREFLSHGYWRRVRERPALLLVALVLLLGPAVLGAVWAYADPAGAGSFVPGAFGAVTEPKRHGADLGLGVDLRSALATRIFTNNIRVTFFAFAGGMTAGLLTAAMLMFNGLLLGVIGGLAFSSGNGNVFTQLVTAHGVLELSCIAVAGAAGLRVGWAIVRPGSGRRGQALRREARAAAEIALGTAPWLVVAGLVEGFITPAGLGLPVVVVTGVGLGALYWTLVLWRGRPATTDSPSASAGAAFTTAPSPSS